jgi:hypothetical protein
MKGAAAHRGREGIGSAAEEIFIYVIQFLSLLNLAGASPQWLACAFAGMAAGTGAAERLLR